MPKLNTLISTKYAQSHEGSTLPQMLPFGIYMQVGDARDEQTKGLGPGTP